MGPEDFLNDRFSTSKSKLMNFRLSKERRKDLEAIVLEGAVAACQEASDSVRRLPEKEKIPQMPPTVQSHARAARLNYELLRSKVEEAPIVPIQKEWLSNIRELLPRHLRGVQAWQQQMIEEIELEVSSAFNIAI